jgi:bifunctional non-homologous end joining protein LigD
MKRVSTGVIPQLSALELQQIDRPFDHADWVFEIKFDGFRSLARIDAGECTLISRNNNVFKRFEGLRRALPADLKGVRDAVLDGEIVVLDAEGRSLFNPLMSSKSTPVFAAFDVLWLNGKDIRDEPLLERKGRLSKLVRANAERVLYVGHIFKLGRALFAEVCRRDLEGIVAKPAESPYRMIRGESPWLKIKNANYSQKEGRGEMFNKRV